MKKRLLAMLLCVAMVASLLTVGAAADVGEDNVESADVVEHTVEIDTYSERNTTNASSSSSTDGLISFTVTDVNGDDISLLDGGVSIRLGEQYTFKVQFSDPDSIKSVYVTSTIGDEVKMLEAVRSGDIFVTSGYFDSDPDYTPGSVGVKYTEIIKNIDVNAPVDWQPMVDTFEDKPEVKAIEADGENANAQFDLAGLLKSESEVLLDVAVELYDNTYGTSFDDFIGAYKNYEELLKYELNDSTTVYVDKTGVQTYFMLVEEKVDNGEKFVKMLMELDDDQNLKDVAEALGEVGTIINFANSYLDINAEANELREEISNRHDLNTDEANALYDKVDEYESDKQLFNLSMTVLPLIAASAAPTAGASIIFGGIVGMISVAANYFWDYRVGMITGSEPADTSFISNAHGTLLTNEIINEMKEKGSLPSGSYCLAGNVHDEIEIDHGTVTICLHGYSCDITNNGGSLTINECGQNENAYFTNGGIVDITNKDGGEVTFNSGSGSIDNYEGGQIKIYGGNVSSIGDDYDQQGADITIYDGSIGHIDTIAGNVFVRTNGTVKTIENNNGLTTVYSGSFGDSDMAVVPLETINGKIIVEGGTFTTKKGEDGRYGSAVFGKSGATIEIYNGVFFGTIGNSWPTSITILNGIFNGDVCNSGKTTIQNGTFYGSIKCYEGITQTSELIINNGNFYNNGETNNIFIDSGNLEINGGTFHASGHNEYNYPSENVRIISPSNNMTINGGTFVSDEGYCINNDYNANSDEGLVVNAGNFMSRNRCINSEGALTINGGTFNSYNTYSCIDSTGHLTINGGTIKVNDGCSYCITSSGNTTINGGIFEIDNGFAAIQFDEESSEDFVITGLIIKGNETSCGIRSQAVTLLVGSEFVLEIDSSRDAFFKSGYSQYSDIKVTVSLANGYTGGLRYYDSKDSKGIMLSSSEFDQIDFSSAYLRLEAEGVVPEGPDEPDPEPGCEHSYTANVIEPTCESRGYTIYTCGKCGNTYVSNYVDATGHSFGDWTITREPTSTTAGQRERICSTCQTKEVETIPATGSGSPTIVGPNWTPSFNVSTPNETENGDVSISDTRADENDTVVITVNPDDGYELVELIVIDANGNEIDVIDLGNGQFGFTMPASAVSIEATFAEVQFNTFVDVTVADWFVDAVEYVVRNSIMEGISDNEFAPLSTMSRAMVWTILARIDGETVTGSNWIATAMKWATNDGVSDGTDANGLVTREQFATMLWRYAGEPASDYSLAAYTDASGVSDWAQAAMCWAVENGIITGVSATTIDPQGTATRAQAAAMLMRFIENIG